MSKLINLIGKRYGYLTVLQKGRLNKPYHTMWLCQCDCGQVKEICGEHLKTGRTISCGCKKIERIIKQSTIHGESKIRLYRIWKALRKRCNNQMDDGYRLYGARGITVCEEWQKDYLIFKEWALLNGYKDNLEIDRIDVNGNYEPLNCRWVNEETQANNKRNNRYYVYQDEKLTLTQICRKYGFNYGTVKSRINRDGKSFEMAIL